MAEAPPRQGAPAAPAGTDPRWARRALALPGQEGLPAPLGATALGGDRCRFVLWAPYARRIEVLLPGAEEGAFEDGGAVSEREAGRAVALRPGPRGYFAGEVGGVPPGTRYRFRLDGERVLPDPASRHQPEGVHGPSEVVEPAFEWTDEGWKGVPLGRLVLYELHVGAFTPEGTLDAVIPRLGELRELGVTALELMPLAQFPGARNWGYDGAYPFAVQNSYGGPAALRRLVDAAHAAGLAVILDVVYNHFGPEGTYLREFGPYFTDRHQTPWGEAVNVDGPHSDEVRRFFIESALYWADTCHVDGFRLDATDRIVDNSALPFLVELARAVHELAEARRRPIHVIAEDDRNAAKLVRAPEVGGYGLDAEWNDDFHHSLHALLTGERGGYYADFGTVEQLAAAFRDGYVYRGERSEYRARRQGSDSRDLPAERLVIFSQNHDQVGNRADARRLAELTDPAAARLAAAAVLLAPGVPLLFMGEEYGDPAPFPYFVSHSDPALIEAVRTGRRAEFAAFAWKRKPPDPQAESTFRSAKLNHDLKREDPHAARLGFYRTLLRLRREIPALSRPRRRGSRVWTDGDLLCLLRRDGPSAVFAAWNFSEAPAERAVALPGGRWSKRLDSSDAAWGGSGGGPPADLAAEGRAALRLPPRTAVLYEHDGDGTNA